MKPANFPARKYARQLRALERLTRRMDNLTAVRRSKLTREQMIDVANRTQMNMLPNARAIRTKKDRTSRGRVSR